jgi:L-aminopeptidase/D-esterase-like protein
MSDEAGGVAGVTDVAGVRVGHWTDRAAATGCSVVILPAGAVASGEVRGGAPGTREWALLDPRRTVGNVNAVVLTGGSAFGLAACDGVSRWCEERGLGYPTPAGPVPIVVGMVLFDLGVGDPSVRPGAEQGYAACVDARARRDAVLSGRIGAGAGATIGKWRGRGAEGFARPAGIGSAVARSGDVVVGALMAVNAFGEPRTEQPDGPRLPVLPDDGSVVTSTTVGVVVTNAAIDKAACRLVAESGHDGLGRALDPAHTAADGDALVAAATGMVRAHVETVRALAAWAVEQAIVDACR